MTTVFRDTGNTPHDCVCLGKTSSTPVISSGNTGNSFYKIQDAKGKSPLVWRLEAKTIGIHISLMELGSSGAKQTLLCLKFWEELR